MTFVLATKVGEAGRITTAGQIILPHRPRNVQ